MCKKTGIFGSFMRLGLIILNFLIFVMGGFVFSLAAILKWNRDLIVEEISSDKALESILNFSALETVSNALLAIGALLVLIGLIGLLGAICASKFFLITYEVLLIMVFLGHGILLLVATFKSSEIEDEFRKELTNAVDIINSPNSTVDEFKNQCDVMKALSTVFECCGSAGPADFVNQTYVEKCCISEVYVGCAEKTVDTIKSNGVEIILIPNVVFLVLELIVILVIPCLVTSIRQAKRRTSYQDVDRRVNYLRPTTEFRKSYGSLKYNYE